MIFDASNSKQQFGLSKSEVVYLVIFHLLEEESLSIGEIEQRIKYRLEGTGVSSKRSYVYGIIKKMEDLSWINRIEVAKRNSTLYLTKEGRKHQKLMKDTNLVIFEKLLEKVTYFIGVLEGDRPKPVVLEQSESKLFNRTINVKIAIHYLFMNYLCNHDDVSGLAFVKQMKQIHDWEFNDGYFYSIVKEMEDDPYYYVAGHWEDSRKRTLYLYNITANGRSMVGYMRETFLESLKENRQYLQAILQLLK